MKKEELELPKWLRIFYIISGSISILFAIVVLINIKFELLITSILFGIALIVIGTTRIVVGIFDNKQSKSLNLMNLVTGIILLPIGLIAIIKHDITIRVVFVFIAVAFLLLGIIGVVKGFAEKAKEAITRLLLIIYGFALIVVAITNLAVDEVARITLTAVFSCGFIVLGTRRLIGGILGEKWNRKKEDNPNSVEE